MRHLLMTTRPAYAPDGVQGMPAFTPATPAAPQAAPAPSAPKRTRKAGKRKAAAKKGPRKARKAATAAAPARRGRTAALTMDVATALALASTVKKKEVGAIQAIVAHLNPFPAKARLRVMQAVADILK